ncbi:MAG: 5'-methylthioadenosine/S-adenosylhomocysteine nucleosidase [Pseudomonadota bacterium]
MTSPVTDLLFVMAAEPEYGPELKKRFDPLMCGVGPVEAGVVLSSELSRLSALGKPPKLVISLGSAGSRTLEQTKVYQVDSVSYRDMDASALGFEKGTTPFLDLPAVLQMEHSVPDLPGARLSTGANIVSGSAYDQIDADMVDMETFAHLRACHQFDIPLIGLRGISDGAGDLHHIDDWTEYLHIIDEKLADAVDLTLDAIDTGHIRL